MKTSKSHIEKASHEFKLASEELTAAQKGLEQHNNATKALITHAQDALALPAQERIERIKELLVNYAALIESVGRDQEPRARSFNGHVMAAIEEIEKGMKEEGPFSSDDIAVVINSLKEFQSSLQGATQNIEYFRGALANMPDLGQPDVLAIRSRVREALRSAMAYYADAGRQMQSFRNHLVHNT